MNPQPRDHFHSPIINPFTPSAAPATDEMDPLTELIQPFPSPTAAPAPAAWALTSARDYLDAHGLRENPFADCVHPGFFYRTESHAEAFRSMMLAVEFDASLGLVTGPSGTGKTLVSQLLLEHLDQPKYKSVLVLVTPGLSKTGLLREILAELNVALPVGMTPLHDLVKLLSNEIIDLHQRGQRLIILLDECHLLTADCLHVVRTISNIETPQRKLVTCLLFGEARLAARLQHPSFESLRNRIYIRSQLAPLTQVDAGQYVKYRLMVAGRMTELFSPAAIWALHAQSGGICRSLNKLCLLSLVEGATRATPLIEESIVATCAARM